MIRKISFFKHPLFALPLTVTIFTCYVVIRITHGLGLSDEGQYYGQIKGLLESGQLFSNDLFIQQIVYLIFYPIFKVYQYFFRFDGIVFFSRLILGLASLAVFFFAYKKYLSLSIGSTESCILALLIALAVCPNGLFAISYNSVSQVIWILFALGFMQWKNTSIALFASVIVLMSIAHPPSAFAIGILIVVRLLLERNWKTLGPVFLWTLTGSLALALYLSFFTNFDQALQSVKFSKGVGVGEFFSSSFDQIILIGIVSVFVIIYLCQSHLKNFSRGLGILFIAFMTIAVFISAWGFLIGSNSLRSYLLSASVVAYLYFWILTNLDTKISKNLTRKINWSILACLVHASVLGMTSGNGLKAGTAGFIVGIPILFGFLSVTTLKNKSNQDEKRVFVSQIVGMSLLVGFFVSQSLMYPYRDDKWWKAGVSLDEFPEFWSIRVTSERAEYLRELQRRFGPVTKDRRTLFISEVPMLYTFLDAKAETCMLYMHSIPPGSEDAFFKCFPWVFHWLSNGIF